VTQNPVTPGELRKAKTIAEAAFVFDMEDMAGQARTLGFFQTMTGDMYNADAYLSKIKQVTAEDILRVSRAYLRPENLSIGLMAPEGENINLEKNRIISLFKGAPDKEPSQEKMSIQTKSETEIYTGNGWNRKGNGVFQDLWRKC